MKYFANKQYTALVVQYQNCQCFTIAELCPALRYFTLILQGIINSPLHQNHANRLLENLQLVIDPNNNDIKKLIEKISDNFVDGTILVTESTVEEKADEDIVVEKEDVVEEKRDLVSEKEDMTEFEKILHYYATIHMLIFNKYDCFEKNGLFENISNLTRAKEKLFYETVQSIIIEHVKSIIKMFEHEKENPDVVGMEDKVAKLKRIARRRERYIFFKRPKVEEDVAKIYSSYVRVKDFKNELALTQAPKHVGKKPS